MPGIRGVVADILKVEKEYETAIETALGGSIQNIVTDNEETAKELISFLKKNKYGRATFLPLTSMNNKKPLNNPQALKEPGVIGIASDLVKVAAEYQGLSVYLLGRTLVVDHIDHGIAIARKYHYSIRMVTLEGESLNPGGSLTGGSFRNNSNLLGRRREIEELQDAVEKLKKDMEDMQKKLEEYRNKRNQCRDQAASIQEQLQEQYIRENTVQVNLDSMDGKREEIRREYENLKLEKEDLEKQTKEIRENTVQVNLDSMDGKREEIRREYENLKLEKEDLEKQTKEIRENTASIKLELETSDSQEKQLEEEINKNQALLEEKKKSEAEISAKLEKLHLESAGFTSRQGFVLENLNRIQEEITNFERQKEGISASMDQGKEEILQKEKEIAQIEETIKAGEEETKRDQEKMKAALEKKEEMTRDHKGFFSRRDELSSKMNLLDKESYRLQGQKEKLEEEQESQTSYMWEEYEMTYGQAKEQADQEPGERGEIKKRIQQIKTEIRQLGNVNVNAIEEYKEISQRHDFMKTQHEDLVKSEETLMGIIEELDTGMRRQFEEKFAQIRIEFDKAFKELFGGGKGTLELDEEEDILEAGIRIISQPPGKKLQNMMQLSGGEKALTAIALLFAIQNLKPSPFCLLDEIEAALDDSNVTRYAQYLHKLTKNTQFIIITHRRGTMTAADRLYGITMQEKGVSTLVSVDLIEHDLDK